MKLPETLKRAVAAHKAGDLETAARLYRDILTAKPDHVGALHLLGVIECQLGRHDEGIRLIDAALRIEPRHAAAGHNRANALFELARVPEALRDYRQALDVQKDPHFHSNLIFALNFDEHTTTAQQQAERALWYELYAQTLAPPDARHANDPDPGRRLRIGYVSAHFRNQAATYAFGGAIVAHDPNLFEVHCYSDTPNEDDITARLRAAAHTWRRTAHLSDQALSDLIRSDNIDILVDCVGHMRGHRLFVFARKPAPIQVSYLGYAATMAADHIDYIIADPVALPLESQVHYTEKIVHLPGCYLANTELPIGAKPPSRAEAGLPEQGFVYCCFNNGWKITPEIFGIWMTILRNCERSVLWLSAMNDTATRNLLAAAKAEGVDPARLVFAPRLARLEDHLARHQLADLFLDTLPYNAHSTAADALWAGLPVLTCKGHSFVGRVASSLLNAIGLNEMIASDLEQYKSLALRLAQDAEMMAEIKSRLARNRTTYPLFDRRRFARNIEAAYATMWDIWQRGERPRSFAVEDVLG